MLDQSFQKNVISYPDVFTEISEKKIDFSEFAPGKTDFSVVDGKHYGVPFDNGAAIACYRTDILQEAGMTLEDFTDITWDEWVEKGKVVLEKTGKPLLDDQGRMIARTGILKDAMNCNFDSFAAECMETNNL